MTDDTLNALDDDEAQAVTDLAVALGGGMASLTPLVRLAVLNRVPEIVRAATDATVAELRSDGVSWAKIGGVLGVTRQAAQIRFGNVTPADPQAHIVGRILAVVEATATKAGARLDKHLQSAVDIQPRRTLGVLMHQQRQHIARVRNRKTVDWLDRMMSELVADLEATGEIPEAYGPNRQWLVHAGYWHQRAAMDGGA